jgi:signal peptidase I
MGALAMLGALLLAVTARRARLEPMLVHGESMLPTLAPGQRIAVGPLRGSPRRGDVVVLRRPEREVVKRVVGLPGERVRLAGGRLEVDGRHVPEPYAMSRPDGAVELDLRLGADELLVLGDYRDRSTDSRSFGPIRRNDLIAIVRFAYWPPRRMRPPK